MENTAYYLSLAPGAFRVPDEEGLVEFLEPDPDANTETRLSLVAEVEGEVAGYLEAELLPPLESARYQSVPYLAHPRLWINSVGTLQAYWRRGIATELVTAAERWGEARGAVLAMCDTWLGSPVSLPFWEAGMGYERRAVILQKRLA
jgi:GNAT superfamily N-acetyltransferase